jgi:transcriptional regulator with XRE-family HTH domain
MKTRNQIELAKELNIPRTYLNGILRGKRKPGIKLAEKISKELDIPFFELRPDLKELLKSHL